MSSRDSRPTLPPVPGEDDLEHGRKDVDGTTPSTGRALLERIAADAAYTRQFVEGLDDRLIHVEGALWTGRLALAVSIVALVVAVVL